MSLLRQPSPRQTRFARQRRFRRLVIEACEVRALLSFGGWPNSEPDPQSEIPLAAVAPSNVEGNLAELYAIAMASPERTIVAADGTALETRADVLQLDAAGRPLVDVWTLGSPAAMAAQLRSLEAEILATDEAHRLVEAWLDWEDVPAVAQMEGVLSLTPVFRPLCRTGSVTSQGDAILHADDVRDAVQFPPGGYDGAGVKVGVLSDSVDRVGGGLADSIASGDLPGPGNPLGNTTPVEVLRDYELAGGTDEGRAMLEIVHDLAPAAELAFRTAFYSELDFAQGIRELAQAGAQVIVDDVAFFVEPAYQDGIIAQAIDEVVHDYDVTYVTAAGNENGDMHSAPFREAADAEPGVWHDFDATAGVDTRLRLALPAGYNGMVLMQWSDPWFTPDGVTSDFDVYAFDATSGSVVASVTTDNLDTQAPLEVLLWDGHPYEATTFDLGIKRVAGEGDVQLKLWAISGTMAEYNDGASLVGHAMAAGAISVGAVPFHDPDTIESYSSRGAVTVYFDPQGNRLATPEVRQKPDLVATDEVNTSFFGEDLAEDADTFPNFAGTSAAAPHVAAIAAQLRSAQPSLSPSQVLAVLRSEADDLGTAGWDDTYGAGRVNALAATGEVLTNPAYDDTTGPTVTLLSPGPSTARPIGFALLQFNEALDGTTAADAGNYEVRSSGDDDVFDNADDVVYTLAAAYDGTARRTRLTWTAPATALPIGRYRLTVGSGVQDLAGNPLGDGAAQEFTFERTLWGVPIDVLPAGMSGADVPVVAVNGTGRSAAVWLEPAIGPNGTFRDIALSLYDANGAQVAGPISVASPFQMEPFGKAVPDVAIGADGSVVVVYNDRWEYYTDSVFAYRFAPDGRLLGTATVAEWGFNTGEHVAVAPNGDFIVVWLAGSDEQGGSVKARLYHSDATPKGDAFQVDPGFYANSPNVAVDGNGDFVVAWARRLQPSTPNAPRDVCARRFDSSGNPYGDVFRVNTVTESSEPSTIGVGILPSGGFNITWHWGSYYSASGTVLARTFASDGTPLGDQWVVSSNGKYPGLAMNSAGDFVIAWSSAGNGYARRYAADGTPLGDPYQAGVSASLGMDDQGAVLHAWAAGQILWYVPPLPAQPDLRVTALSFVPTATIGERIELTSRVFNFGVTTAAASQLQYYLSPDAEITGTGNDRPLLTTPASVGSLWGGSSAGDLSRTMLPADVTPGTWWLGALADAGQTVAETDETNNALALPILLVDPPPRLGREFRVNTTTAGAQTTPGIVSGPDGSFVVIWSGKGPGDDQGIFLQRYSAALVPAGTEQRVNQTTTGVQSAPAIAVAGDGSFVVTWESPDASGKGVYARRYDTGAAPLADEFLVNTTTAGDQAYPDVSVAADGTFTVAWTTLQTGDWNPTGIRSQRYDGNGAPAGAEVTVSTNVSGYASHPVVASLPDGRSLVAWEYGAYGNAGFDLHYRLLGADGQPAGSDQLVVSGGCWLYSSLAVASDASGRTLLVWQTWDQAYFDVYGQWISASGDRVGSPFVVNSNKTGCSNVDVAVLADGNFIVEWSTADASSAGVYAQRLAPDGSWVGGEWRINEYVTNAQVLPKAAGLRGDSFAVVWASTGQDGDGNGIYGRVFGTAPTDLAELQAVSVTGPLVTYLGGPLPVTATVKNVGGLAAPAFQVQYALFAQVYADPLYSVDLPVEVTAGLAAGDAWTDARTLTVPTTGTPAGTYYLGIIADSSAVVAEHIESDNTGVSLTPVIVCATAPPDLQVSSVSVLESSVVRGHELTVTWTVVNRGMGAAPSTTWYDQVIFSGDSVYGNADDVPADSPTFSHAGGLAKDASYAQTQTARVPFSLTGSVYVFVKADATGVISEPAHEDNNSAADPLPRPVTEIAATLPVAEGFEGGSLAALPLWWALHSGTPGRAAVASTNGPHAGSYHLLMDSAYFGGQDTQCLYLTVDVGDGSGVMLRYWQKDFSSENNNPLPDTFTGRVDGDGVAMSADGSQWYRLESLVDSDSATSYQQHVIDLGAERLRRGLTASSRLYLVFQHCGDRGIANGGGFAFDDIGLAVESGDFRGARGITSTPSGTVSGPVSSVQVTFSEPVDPAGFTHADVRLVDPAGRVVTIADAGITTTDNVNFTIAFPPQAIAGTYQLSVGPQIADLAGNAMNQDQDWVNGAADDVFTSSFQLPATTAALPVLEGFEVGDLGELPSYWSFETRSGAIGISNGAPHTGQSALQMFDSTNWGSYAHPLTAILHVDLLDGTTPATGVTLDFWVKEISGGGYTDDACVKIKTGGTTWTNLQNIAGASSYQHYAFNLDALGLTYSDDVEIAFQHTNYWGGGFLWDDIRVGQNLEPFGPWIVSHSPTGAVSAPLTGLQVTFNEDIDAASFTGADVKLTGPTGHVAWAAADPVDTGDHRTFTVQVPPQWLAGAYTISVGPGIQDLAGNSMNQDHDAANGEGSGDDYPATLQVGPPTAVSVPYLQSFDSGDMGSLSGWSAARTCGSAVLSVANPEDGSYAVEFSETSSRYSTAYYQEMILHADLAGRSGVVLDFWAKQVGTAPSYPEDLVVSISTDGTTWTPLATIDGATDYRYYAYDLDSLGVAYTSDVQLRFRHISYYAGTLALDGIRVRPNALPINQLPTLTTISTLTGAAWNQPYTISFESLAAAADESDPDSGPEPLTFRIESVTSGTVTKSGLPVQPGTTLLGADESVVWTPAWNVSGVVNAFRVRAWDGDLASWAPVQVKVEVPHGYRAEAYPFEDLDLVPGMPGVITLLDNSTWASMALPLGGNAFTFFASTQAGDTALYSNTSGLLTFVSGWENYENSDLSSVPTPAAIAALWDRWRTDLTAADVVLYQFEDVTGDGTDDRLIVEWSQVSHYTASASNPATFQAILQLNTGTERGVIVLNYPDLNVGVAGVNNGAGATVGIKASGAQGLNRLLVSYNNGTNPLIGTGKAVRITSSTDATPPTAVISSVLPNPRDTAVDSVSIVFSEPVSGLKLGDLALTRDGGGNLLTAAQTLMTSDQVTWTLGNLAPLTATTGVYELQLAATGSWIRDGAWNLLASDVHANWTMDTAPPAPVSLSPADNAVGVPTDTSLAITFDEAVRKGTGTIVLRRASDGAVVETIDVAGAGVSVTGTTATIVPSVTLQVLTDYYVEVAAGAFEDLAGHDFAGLSGAAAWNFATQTLRVTALLPNASGFLATFNGPLDTSVLNLYDGAGGSLGAADMVVVNGFGQNLAGSLIVAADFRAITWVATGSRLPAGTYTVTLTSGATAFHHVAGHALDGDADGISGGDYSSPFTILASPDRVLSVPDFARGAGQPLNVPAAASGLPIRLDDAAGVTSLAVDLVYDQAQLTITAATLAAGVPADWAIALDTATPGVAKITASGTTALSGTDVDVVRLTAAVPSDAPYGAIQAIRLDNVSLNGGTIAAIGDVAVHKAVYLGDADGSGIHSSADAFLTVQAALGLASGFAAHAWTDPRIVGDADGSGVLSAADAFLIVQEGLGLAEPFVPDNPHITVTPVGGGVDPQFRIGVNLPASADGAVTVPVKLNIEEEATNVGAIDFDLFFDPSRLTIQVPDGVLAGADTGEWAVNAILVASGQLRVGMVSSRGWPLAPGLREIARLQFQVEPSRMGLRPVRDGLETRPTVLPPITDHRLPITEVPNGSEAHPTWLDIEPVDARAGGYTWTDVDGSVLIRLEQRALAVATRERVWRDLDAKADLLERVLADLTLEIASAWR